LRAPPVLARSDDSKEAEVGRVVVSQFVTVDGVFEDPGGSEGHERGGWALQFNRGDDGDRFKLDEVMASDALLLGRVTYEGFAAAWPSREGEFADKFNGMQKYVVSSTLGDPDWNNSTVVAVDDVPGLREAEGGDILVNGSAQLVAELLERDLVDELRLMFFPTVLGSGRRLFGDMSGPKALRLAESRPIGPDGVTILIYQPVTRED
jgi:dihydrofolate reductase